MSTWMCPVCGSSQVVVTDDAGDTVAEDADALEEALANYYSEELAFLCLSCGEVEAYDSAMEVVGRRETPEDREADEFWQAVDYYYDRAHDR